MEIAFWLAVLLVSRRVKAREVPAYDFILPVALDSLGSRIPARDMAGRIKQENGVVSHTLNQHLELGLLFTLALFRSLALGQVTRHFREPDEVAGIVPNGINQHVCPEE